MFDSVSVTDLGSAKAQTLEAQASLTLDVTLHSVFSVRGSWFPEGDKSAVRRGTCGLGLHGCLG